MTARAFKQHELKRTLATLEAEGKSPTCLDLLPGGAGRIWLTPPPAANDRPDMAAEEAKWLDAITR